MLKIPEWAPALDRRDAVEVVCRRRRSGGPFESPRIPRIASGGFATEVGPDQVSQEDQNPGSLEENSDGHNEVPRVPTAPRFVRVDPSRHAHQSWDMHKFEFQGSAHYEKPKLQLPERPPPHH